jgi:hypothetical protein
MQFTKDSFYLALRERMMALNPQRRVMVDGVSRAAIFASENEPVSAQALQEDSFYLRWGGRSRKRDFTQSPSVDLGSDIFWSEPELAELETGDASDSAAGCGGAILQRSARLTLYFFPEVDFS